VDVSLGPVWYPSVSVGWYPYSQGYWSYTSYGYTWVSYEPWGWAPYHYGRWGYNQWGWYWVPGVHWGPAWVSWAIGPSWVGWCPLGYRDRPVHYYRGYPSRGGKAVPRGSVVARTRGDGWSFTQKEHFGRSSGRGKARLRAADIRATAPQARVLESGAILDRNLRPSVVGAAAMTRLPKGGIAARARRTESGSLVTGSSVMSRGGNPTGNRVVNESGRIQAGQARSRTRPGSALSSGEARRSSGNSVLSGGTALGSAARSRSSSGVTAPGNRIQRDPSLSQGKPLGTRGAAVRRGNDNTQSSSRTGNLTQGRSRVLTQPSGGRSNPSTGNPSRSGLETGRTIRSRPSTTPSRTPARNSSSVGRRFSRTVPSSPQRSESSSTVRGVQRSLRSQTPGSSNPSATGTSRSRSPRSLLSPSKRVETPSPNQRDSSVRGRSIYDRITRSNRTQANRPSSPSRSQPSARTPASRPKSTGTPSRMSSPSRSNASSGRARSTRSRKKK
jgi:hypothetical protein